jgi:hypothetical protein
MDSGEDLVVLKQVEGCQSGCGGANMADSSFCLSPNRCVDKDTLDCP